MIFEVIFEFKRIMEVFISNFEKNKKILTYHVVVDLARIQKPKKKKK